MSKIYPECRGSAPSDRPVPADVFLREELDEDQEEDGGGGEDDEMTARTTAATPSERALF